VAFIVAFSALPTVLPSWVPVDTAAATQLRVVESKVPPRAEVVASNGLVGRFAERKLVFVLGYSPQSSGFQSSVPVDGSPVFFVVSPSQGTGVLSPFYETAIADMRHRLHARVVTSQAGVYAFEWAPGPGTRSVDFLSRTTVTGSATLTGSAGTPVRSTGGPPPL